MHRLDRISPLPARVTAQAAPAGAARLPRQRSNSLAAPIDRALGVDVADDRPASSVEG